MSLPQIILLISGKRKCGKDFIAEKLRCTLRDENCCILRISEPIKKHYAEKHNLEFEELMSASTYKEQHRLAMIEWSDNIRSINPGYFCESACSSAPSKKYWIVSDIRRQTDMKWFKETFGAKIKAVRITADENVRIARGWTYQQGIDDVNSECGLDDYTDWDLIIVNNNEALLDEGFSNLLKLISFSIDKNEQ